ncbi:hypothetical protein H0H81_005383 [Sphagnurus paluster]|uniref:Uncharacterized protein n=1 Tax=Sphagnurus paluster TaxID=117069 RepID=A0A9P7GEQ3_9AGAR|nr:hypothetical protein H0H81_005383 [Sphagnurus paluster]
MAPQVATCPCRTAGSQPAHNASPNSEDFDWSLVHAVIEEEGAEDAGTNAPSNMATNFTTPTPSVQIQDVATNPSKKKQAHNIVQFFKTEDITDGSKTIKKKVCQICKTAPSCNVNYQYSTTSRNTVLCMVVDTGDAVDGVDDVDGLNGLMGTDPNLGKEAFNRALAAICVD